MAVQEAYVPSTPFLFSNTNLIIDVPWEVISPEHITLYTLVDTQMTPIDRRKYEVRGNRVHMTHGMIAEGGTFYVRRKVPLLQPYSSVGITHVKPSDLERALDNVIMAAQELQSRELFTHVIEDYQSLGYIEYTQGWRLGMDGSADISGHFHGSVNITSGTIDGRTVEIIGSTSHRQHMQGFADAELGTIDVPQIDGLNITASGRYISVIVFMSKLFGGVRTVQLQISRTGVSWYALPENPNITDDNSWRGPSEGVTEIQGTQIMTGPLPMYTNQQGGPAETNYYIRARGVRADGFTTGWTLGELVTLIPSEELGPGVITETHIADDSISTPKLRAMSVVAGKIAADAIQAGHISANAVVAGKIDANAITAREIAAGSITADEIDVTDLFAQDITATGSITGLDLVGGSIDIGDGDFTVDATGAMFATNAHIEGEVVSDRAIFYRGIVHPHQILWRRGVADVSIDFTTESATDIEAKLWGIFTDAGAALKQTFATADPDDGRIFIGCTQPNKSDFVFGVGTGPTFWGTVSLPMGYMLSRETQSGVTRYYLEASYTGTVIGFHPQNTCRVFLVHNDGGEWLIHSMATNGVGIPEKAIEFTAALGGGTHHMGSQMFMGNLYTRLGSLPTSDPGVAGQIWRDGGTLKVSL